MVCLLLILIPLMNLMNQKIGNNKHLILFPWQLKLSFPNDDITKKSMTGLGPNYGKSLT